jgi:membrane protease YdiL (CAAX protease family)
MAIFIPTSPSNPFIKLAVPVVAILFVYVVARARKMTASDLMLQKPPAQAALIWVAVYAIFVLGTDALITGAANSILRSGVRSLFVTACRVLAVGIFGPVAEELIFRGILFNRFRRVIRKEWIGMTVVAIIWGAAPGIQLAGRYVHHDRRPYARRRHAQHPVDLCTHDTAHPLELICRVVASWLRAHSRLISILHSHFCRLITMTDLKSAYITSSCRPCPFYLHHF